jgi:hypothetical protein
MSATAGSDSARSDTLQICSPHVCQVLNTINARTTPVGPQARGSHVLWQGQSREQKGGPQTHPSLQSPDRCHPGYLDSYYPPVPITRLRAPGERTAASGNSAVSSANEPAESGYLMKVQTTAGFRGRCRNEPVVI